MTTQPHHEPQSRAARLARRLRYAVVLGMLATLCVPTVASAGDYTVNFGASGQPLAAPDFRGFSSGSPPWQILPTQVYAPPANYIKGSYGMYRFYVPSGLTVYRFCATSVVSTSNTDLYYQVDANNTTVYGKTYGSGTYTTCTTPTHTFPSGNYIDVALIFDSNSTITGTSNKLTYSKIAVSYRDLADPVIGGVSVPSGWIGPNSCNLVSWTTSDTGAGVKQTQLLRSVAIDYDYTRPGPYTWPKPGAASQAFSTCLPNPGSTGTHSYVIAAYDFSDNRTLLTIPSQSWDLTLPALSTQIVDDTVYDTYRPSFTFAASDAHSGVASVQAYIDGQEVVSTVSGAQVTFHPASDLALGSHSIAVAVTDRVGNRATLTRTIRIGDATAPTISVASPADTEHGASPVLDVTGTDDKSGVDPASWSVTVNGQPLAASSATSRLQVAIGRLVNGTHTIVVHVADNAGNTRDTTIKYTVTSEAVTPPGLHGLFVLASPSVMYERASYSITAIAATNGRPVAAGRFEVAQNGSIIAGKDTSPDGTVDLLIAADRPGPLELAITGSGLAPVSIAYTYHEVASAPWCRLLYPDPACDARWGTSGIVGLDHVKPRLSLGLINGSQVLRRGLSFGVRTSERASATFTLPKGLHRSQTVMPARVNVVRFRITSTYAKQIGLKTGTCVRMPVTLTARDPAGNAASPIRRVFRVCG